ncbi:MAG: UbiD family decarboxylase [Chloroflexota bacterium]
MAYRDLREWINRLEQEDELVRVTEEIRLEPDIGAIGRAISDLDGPAILAENIFGFADTGRLAIGLTGTQQRVSLALGLAKDTPIREQKRYWLEAYDKYPVKPVMVKDAPCKENIVSGDKVNLFDFPVPRLNTKDPAPFIIKTAVITKDPGSDWINSGTYRMQVLDRNRTAMRAAPYRDLGEHYKKCRQMGQDLECVVALGIEPVLGMFSGARVPRGCSEFDVAGALRGEPEELVMAESVNLPVPASAEIVLEGVVKHDEQVFEGFFGEDGGAYSRANIVPVFHINTITYRNNPIFDHLYIGRSPCESGAPGVLFGSAMLERELKAKFPQITEVAMLWPSMRNVVIQGKWGHRGEPDKVIAAFFGSETAGYNTKLVTIVDEDIDPWNGTDVIWAIICRAQADKDFVSIPKCHSALDPSKDLDGLSCLLGIDATKPRPPYDRNVSEWVEPPVGTGAWREKIKRMTGGGK